MVTEGDFLVGARVTFTVFEDIKGTMQLVLTFFCCFTSRQLILPNIFK
jgi:hypothetical protein